MKTIGDKFPEFNDMKAVVSTEKDKEFKNISLKDYNGWKVIFFWPLDFTFVCPTEIAEFSKLSPEFELADAQVLGFSADSHFTHLAWRKSHDDLKELKIPMVSDYRKELSTALGILHRTEGSPLRATFIVDQENTIRFVSVNDLSVGRNVKEVLRVLNALQTDELCPCNWEKGKPTLG